MKKNYIAPTLIFDKADDVIRTSIETEFIPFNIPDGAYDISPMSYPTADPYNIK